MSCSWVWAKPWLFPFRKKPRTRMPIADRFMNPPPAAELLELRFVVSMARHIGEFSLNSSGLQRDARSLATDRNDNKVTALLSRTLRLDAQDKLRESNWNQYHASTNCVFFSTILSSEVKHMATPEFVYQDPFPLSKDDTPYRLL